MKRVGVLVTFLILAALLRAQTGPGGVGSSSNNILWLRADAITGISDGGSIQTWSDQSGNSHDATQATANRQPTYSATNSNLNSKPTVLFDNTNDFMDFGFSHSASDYTWVFVYKTVQINKGDLFDSKTGKLEIIHRGGGDKAYKDVTSARGTEITGTAPKMVMWRLDNAGASVYESGTQTQSGLTYIQSPIGATTRLASKEGGGAGGDFLQGDIAEGIAFDYALNTAERIIVENYVGNKYGFTIANDKFAYESIYEDDIAGIGREDASNQNIAAQSAKIFKVSNASAMGNGDYLLFGHDAGSISSYTTTESPNTEIKRIAREWRLDETGNVGTITITMDTAILPAHASGYPGYAVMIDADGDFSSGSKIYVLSSAGGSTYSISGIPFNDGDYVTFGCARNVYKNVTGNFNTAANWADGSVPLSGELAIIPNDATVTLSANATIGELIIYSTGSLDLSSNMLSLDNNTITNNGTLTMSTGTINYAKAGSQNINAFTFYNLTISGSGTKTLTANTIVNGSLTISAGTLDIDNSNNYNLTVKGGWVNSGTFTARNGTVTLNGSGNQAITSNGSGFYNLTINNTTTQVSLNDNLTVSNALTLTDGVITTGSYRVIISSTSASALTGYSSASFINGNLRRNITTNTSTYGFPVGNGTGSTNYYLAEMINGSLTGITYIDSKFKPLTGHNDSEMNVTDSWTHGYLSYTTMNTAGVWELEPNASPTGGSYSVKLYIANMTGLTDNNFGPLKRPVGSTSGAAWTTGGGTLNNSDSPGRTVASGYMQRSGLTGFSEFGGGGGTAGGAGLPIELVSFTAQAEGNAVNLNWTTATETNNNFFTIEKSVDGIWFDEVLMMEGAGNSSEIRHYAAIDTDPYKGTSYYRLEQTDYNGGTKISGLVSVYMDLPQIQFSVSPNPVINPVIYIRLETIPLLGTTAQLSIANFSGRIVLSEKIKLNGSEALPVALPAKVVPGLYFVTVQYGNTCYRQKLFFN